MRAPEWSRARPRREDFRLPPERPERILLISGGSGITPVISMLRTLCAEGHEGPIAFLHYAPDPELAIYRDELETDRRCPPERQAGSLLHAGSGRGRG
jgi:ferredoxin-NADP reductase